jgi:uncharacterized protein
MTHAHGTFCFAELNTHDVGLARQFYADVLGWTAVETPGGDGGYLLFQLNGHDVAGLRRAKGATRWVPYVAVDSVDQTLGRAQELRASIVSAPFDMQGFARKALLTDPAGGTVGLWEARGHDGAAVLDTNGAMWWAELLTRDVHGAKAFYANLLGWKPVDTLKYGIRYTVFKQGEDSVAGILPIASDWGPVSPYWQVLFAVENCDAAVDRAKAAGGSLVYGPNDIPNAGRAAIVADQQHAVCVLMQPNE